MNTQPRHAALAALLIALSTSALAAPPPASEKFTARYVAANLEKDVTTREQVLERFGTPTEVRETADSAFGLEEVFHYTSYSESAKAKLGGLRRFVSNAAEFLPSDKAYRVYSALGDVSRVEGKLESAQNMAGADHTNRSIRITLRKGVVTSFRLD